MRLGSRALDLLIILLERAGEVVSKEELIARVWPDTAVEDSGIRVQVASLRKALGEGVQGARYVANVPGRGYSFVGSVGLAEVRASVAPVKPPARGRNLPARIARIVGRERTIVEVSEQLRTTRFVSVVGPGGMGKSTVAVAVAHELLHEFEGDVCFVDLGALSDAQQVATSLASALGLSVPSDDVRESLLAFLGERRTLLVLDSCEHVVAEAAALAEKLTLASGVHLLVTSREALRAAGEHVHRLTPLACPPDEASVTATTALAFPAVQLFMERAAASGTKLALSDAEAPIVAEICRRVDGIPLAIEFAAGRVDTYGLRETASLLENRFKLLWHGRRTALPRHQTLSALLDWSYNLLEASERTALRRLSLLVGSFMLEDGVAMLGGDEEQAIGLLGSLVDKSLISVDRDWPEGTRYRLLDTTRAYAQSKLATAGEHAETARAHATYLCRSLLRANREPPGAILLVRHLGNVRAALAFCFSDGGESRLGVELACAAIPLFMGLSLLRECHTWVEVSMAALQPDERGTRRELDLQAGLGVAAMFTRGNGPEVRAALMRALALADELDEPQEQLRLLGALNILMARTGEWREGLLVGQRSGRVAERLGDDPAARRVADWMVGTCVHLLGDQREAELRCRSALEPAPCTGSTAMLYFGFDHRVRALIVLARALWLLGRADDALHVAELAIRDAALGKQPTTIAISLVWTSSVFVWCGDLERADEVIARLLAHAEKHSLGPYCATAQALRGELLLKRGDPAGLELLRTASETLHAGLHDLLQTVFATAMAEGFAQRGRFDEAVRVVDGALALTKRNQGEAFDVPEMLRVKARLYLRMPFPDEAAAEHCLRLALERAGQQHALAWELRAALTLGELRARQGDGAEARRIVATVHDRFGQGFATADLRAARAFLDA